MVITSHVHVHLYNYVQEIASMMPEWTKCCKQTSHFVPWQ